MDDLQIAKTELNDKNLSLVIVKDGNILYSTSSHRISGFLDAIDKCGEDIRGASVADRVIGKAVALLSAYIGVREVHAGILSKRALAILKKYNIGFSWIELVDNVLDPEKVEICPFEEAAANLTDPQKAYTKLRTIFKTLRACKPNRERFISQQREQLDGE